MRIVVDAMGGDHAPEEIIAGAVKALELKNELNLILIGKSDIINPILAEQEYDQGRIEVVNASQAIKMDESPTTALRKKKDSSIYKGTMMVKDKKAEAFVSAGNTGAVMASGLFNIGRIEGIKRPAIATIFPSVQGQTLVIDAGANTDSAPENLLQFALMGQIYARFVLGVKDPELGLLNIGEEKKKGNKLTAATYELLENDSRIENFVGNVEGRDIFNGRCDVVICDGFVGNIVLKTTEGVASYFFQLLKEALTRNIVTKTGALLIKSHLKEMLDSVDYRQYGGAPLLGVDGVVIISHGSSDATAFYNAIKVAMNTVEQDVINLIKDVIDRDGEINGA